MEYFQQVECTPLLKTLNFGFIYLKNRGHLSVRIFQIFCITEVIKVLSSIYNSVMHYFAAHNRAWLRIDYGQINQDVDMSSICFELRHKTKRIFEILKINANYKKFPTAKKLFVFGVIMVRFLFLIQTECGDLKSKYPYSIRMQGNKYLKNSIYRKRFIQYPSRSSQEKWSTIQQSQLQILVNFKNTTSKSILLWSKRRLNPLVPDVH